MQNIISAEQLRITHQQLLTNLIISNKSDYYFTIPQLSESSNQEVSQLMNKHKNECGCSLGSKFMGLGIVALICYFIIDQQPVFQKNFKHYIIIVSFIIGCAIIGKIVGLLWARFRMIQIVNKTIGLLK